MPESWTPPWGWGIYLEQDGGGRQYSPVGDMIISWQPEAEGSLLSVMERLTIYRINPGENFACHDSHSALLARSRGFYYGVIYISRHHALLALAAFSCRKAEPPQEICDLAEERRRKSDTWG